MKNRVVFYSKEDLSKGHNLNLAEPILRNFDSKKQFNLNDIIELYNIKLYFDNELFLSTWSKKDINEFKETIKEIWDVIRRYWININGNNIIELINNLEIGSHTTFWLLIEKFENYKKISEKTFCDILNNDNIGIREILYRKKIVNYFDKVIREYLLEFVKSAELLLSQYEEKHDENYSNLHFPKCLTLEDREFILLQYLEYDDANLNYIRLIDNLKNSDRLKITPKTRLKANRLAKEKNEEILKTGYTVKYGTQVEFAKDQEEPKKEVWEGNTQKVSYSTDWIKEHNDSFSLFHLFSFLFGYTNEFGNITLISKDIELDEFEKIMMQSKNAYSTGVLFNQKSNLSHLQIFSFYHYLKKNNKSLEGIILDFVKEYLNEYFGLRNFRIVFPTDNASNLEKVRMIAPEFESMLKQFKLYVTEGKIDHDLLQISSAPLNFKNIPSLVNKKYAYGYGKEFQKLKFLFFSDQSMLWYVEPYKDKYKNLYYLLLFEDIKLDDFKRYQKPAIEELIEEGYLKINSKDYVKIEKFVMLTLIGKLFEDEVLSYWHFTTDARSVIDEMEKKELIYFDNTLFAENEQKYFNYYLNKSEFTNGLDLRNKYLHGTNRNSDKEHENSYFIYLKLLVLAILKIEDDLIIKNNFCDH